MGGENATPIEPSHSGTTHGAIGVGGTCGWQQRVAVWTGVDHVGSRGFGWARPLRARELVEERRDFDAVGMVVLGVELRGVVAGGVVSVGVGGMAASQ